MTSLQELILKSPDPMAAILKMGQAIAESRMFGAGNPMQGVVIVTHCLDKGIPLLDWAAEYHLVEAGGKMIPTMKADAMLSRFQREGGTFVWDKDGADQLEAVLTLRLNDRQQTVRYTTDDAKRAGLIKADKPSSAWNANRPAMLRARCVSSGLRMFSPSTISGVYTADELGGESVDGDFSSPAQPESAAVAQANQVNQESQQSETKRRGRPAGSKNKETGAAEVAVADASVGVASAESAATNAAPIAETKAAEQSPANHAPATPASPPQAPAPVAQAPASPPQSAQAADDDRAAQVKWIERMKAKYYALTPEKLKEMGVPDDKIGSITLNDAKWAVVQNNLGTGVIAEMPQEGLDALESMFKTREERLQPFVKEQDVESFLNKTLQGK